MQYKIYTVPIVGGDEETERLNRFLRANKIVKVDKEFVVLGESAGWSFCVQYLLPVPTSVAGDRKVKVDYKDVLSAEQFAVFSRLRKCRKAIADEDAIPAFAVFVDSELAEMSKLREITEKTMLEIDGVGEQRVRKFAGRIMEKMHETDGKPDTTDS